MKIIFICGALKPGYDGVGDYTRRLSANLIIQGVEVAILALNDQFIAEVICQDQTSDGVNINTCRIPSNWNIIQRINYAKKWIISINPDWLSLQYVPFSFNSKGLPFNLSKHLSKLTFSKRWHIMFHELWVGMSETASLKHIIWGEIQKKLIKDLINKIEPNLIHTQTKLYQIQLTKLGFKTKYLPLFSNITVGSNFKDQHTFSKKSKIRLVNFGTIHPTVPIEEFAYEAAMYEKKTGTIIELILIGRCGAEQNKWINVWKSSGLNISVYGEQSSEEIYSIFNSSTFGITTTALSLIEKSGSVAAMLELNLPVICVSNAWNPRGISDLPKISGIIEYCIGNFESLMTMSHNTNISYLGVVKVSELLKKDIVAASF